MKIREKGHFIENQKINYEDGHLKFLITDRGDHYERYQSGWLQDLRLRLPLITFMKSTPQLNTDPLSSTHQFNTRTTPFQPLKPVSSIRQMRLFNTPVSSTYKKASAQHTRQFNTTNQSVQHKKASVQHQEYRAIFCRFFALN